ncbi:hypothetical protein [Lactiplantibacillus daowaiensis]|uniref:Prophage protein n=1 Tax=Lactiplantibacillus daowaiensis TaxID=2559918 RepID=A0ABW1RYU2_9LACO|nr:hypothetical protein [Lactiplantibacillus daowaiensis]
MFERAKQNVNHILLGAVLMGVGLFLMTKQNYFSWPPVMAKIENSDTFGCLFILVGIAMIWWALDKKKSARANHLILIFASWLMTVLVLFQFFHWAMVGLPMPWISNLGLLGEIMLLAKRSDSQ